MAKRNPVEEIEAFRQRQGRRSTFIFADISKVIFLLMMLTATVYAALTGGPELPTLVELKTNTPTLTPSITPTQTNTLLPTATATETQVPGDQCKCPSPEVVIITATVNRTNTPQPLPSATMVVPMTNFSVTVTLIPSETSIPINLFTPTSTVAAKPTELVYTVRQGDTLGVIAFRFGVTVESIQNLNNLNTTMIYEGQVLQIPKP